MTEREFYLWLKGYFDVSQSKKLTEEQVSVIKAKLNEVAPFRATTGYLEGISNVKSFSTFPHVYGT